MPVLIHWIYHLIDSADQLAYIGRSVSPKGRWRRHEKTHGEVFKLVLHSKFESLEEAQAEELSQIKNHWPRLNKYLASSPSRLGMSNTAEHNATIARNNSNWDPVKKSASAKKGWETRDRGTGSRLGITHSDETKALISAQMKERNAKFGNAFLGRKHSEETKEKIRQKSLAQQAKLREGAKQ